MEITGGEVVPYLVALTREITPRVTINDSLFRRWSNLFKENLKKNIQQNMKRRNRGQKPKP